MYQSPFGSIFGDGPLSKPEAPKPQETPASEPPPTPKKEVPRYEEVRAPKAPFSNEESQFRASSTVVSTDPNVLLAQSVVSLEKSKIKYMALDRKLQELRDKTVAAEVYLSVIKEIPKLPASKQKEIEDFINKNEKRLKGIILSEKVLSTSKNLKEATASLDAEIKHWEVLNKEKGKVELKSFRPTKREVTEELPVVKVLPKIGGPAAKIVRLDKQGIMQFGDAKVDQVTSSKPKDQEYYIKYMSKLPNQADFVDKRKLYFKAGSLEKKAENNLLLSQQFDWKALQLTTEIEAATNKYKALQAEIVDKTSLVNPKIATGLSAAVTANPANFRSGILLDNLRASIPSGGLSGFGENLPAVVGAGKQEIQTREKVLTDLQTQVITGVPATAPTAPVAKQKPLLMILAGLGLLLLLLRSK